MGTTNAERKELSTLISVSRENENWRRDEDIFT